MSSSSSAESSTSSQCCRDFSSPAKGETTGGIASARAARYLRRAPVSVEFPRRRGGVAATRLRKIRAARARVVRADDFQHAEERQRFGNREVRQNLAVQIHRSRPHARDEAVVRDALRARARVDRPDPRLAHLALLDLAVAERVLPRLLDLRARPRVASAAFWMVRRALAATPRLPFGRSVEPSRRRRGLHVDGSPRGDAAAATRLVRGALAAATRPRAQSEGAFAGNPRSRRRGEDVAAATPRPWMVRGALAAATRPRAQSEGAFAGNPRRRRRGGDVAAATPRPWMVRGALAATPRLRAG